MPTQADIQNNNEIFLAGLEAGGGFRKQAVDRVTSWTRLREREDGIQDKILPAEPLQSSQLDVFVNTNLPGKIVGMEPDSPAATLVNYRNFPTQYFITSSKYAVMGERITSPWFQIDVAELSGQLLDVRQIMADNTAKDVEHARDKAFFDAIDRVLVGPNQIQPFSQVVQWRRSDSSVSRNSLTDMKRSMLTTPGRLAPVKCVTNVVTRLDLTKFTRNEAGGDWSQDVFKKGWAESEFMEMDWFFTIKYEIVPNGAFYMFADNKWLGKAYEFAPFTMAVDKKAFMVDYFLHGIYGATLGNPYAVTREDLRV